MPPSLTRTEVHRLTLFKWRYSLEARGFTSHEAARILFLRWLVDTQRVTP